MMKRRIGLYGGTFDPVHHGHLSIARKLIEVFGLDEVMLIPAHVPPHKRDADISPAWHRYAMLALATQHDARLCISTIELDAPERPYTIDTLNRIKALYDREAARFFFIMGADSWAEIVTWYEWERVISAMEIVVVTRPEYEISTAHVGAQAVSRIVDLRGKKIPDIAAILDENRFDENKSEHRIYFTDAVFVPTAAREIRCRVRESNDESRGRHGLDDLVDLVPPPVAEYINKYRLYRD
ncbi:MAG: nicotinate-nucleotide adenylyltransferase [Pyrinomonadaceae bacterium MAG19_C2-C3]|nr:nicotinate-nucleotide adenylyltransferase [Pyrinomonadaceae bacterium MAG19_C2-C3]